MNSHHTPTPDPAVSAVSDSSSRRPLSLREEGRQRERLAVYFLSLPPGAPDCLAGKPGDDYRRAARELSSLELSSVLQLAGRSRPLRCGDAAALFRAVAQAAARRLADQKIELTAELPDAPVITTMEPRLAVFSLLRLFREATAFPREGRVLFRLRACPERLLFTVAGGPGFSTAPTMALIRETGPPPRGGGGFL